MPTSAGGDPVAAPDPPCGKKTRGIGFRRGGREFEPWEKAEWLRSWENGGKQVKEK